MHFRKALIAAAPACLIAATFLAFFAAKAFTIDDPIFLRGAEQALRTPLHPLSYSMPWDATATVRPVSSYVPNAPLMPYLLIPAVLSSHSEIVGHLLQILLLVTALVFTASIALRLELSPSAASLATALTATCPAVLGMAATVMPDVLAMALGVIGMDQFIAWRQNRRWWNAVVAANALALAPLARPHLAVLIPAGGFILAPVSAAISLGLNFLTKDPSPQGGILSASLVHLEPLWLATRGMSFGVYLALTTPFAVAAAALMSRRWLLAAVLLPVGPLVLFGTSGQTYWILLAIAELAFIALAWAITRLWRIRVAYAFALSLWAMLPFAVFAYSQMAPKYLVPSMPAYSIILVMLAGPAASRARYGWAALLTAGLLFSILIVSADRTAANMARAAVEKWSPQPGKRVFFRGQWGFQRYAEQRGAHPFDPSAVASGDLVMVDVTGGSELPPETHAHLLDAVSNTKSIGVLLDSKHKVGFYSDGFGRLPWYWAAPGTLRFELWRID